ncbi:uncharacterized protein TNIN_274971 [Trichonephila inaurata madagascariensis]|uniref:Uncharacterized protein n=1 Tax=Trichonephila inaurata madagascariensis TaxID=2747483 RepID=A0A8X7BSF5_9ARAC|nr:uncharacterized protein TNIN_274971 [Trichonephila inaurata madagascariensis]
MNNYRGYSPPISNFSPRGRHQHQIFPNRPPVHGPYRSPNYDDKGFYWKERSEPYPRTPYFERTSFSNSPPSAMRHEFRDEDFNMYRQNPQFRHLRKEDMYSYDGLLEMDQRTHLQNAPIKNYNKDSLDKISYPYSDTHRFNAKYQSFFNMEQNYSSVRQDGYPDFSSNAFPRQNACDVPSPFKRFNNSQNYDRNVDSVQNEPSYLECEPTSNKIISSPIYSKNLSHSDFDIFSKKRIQTVPFPQKQNLFPDNKSSVKKKILDYNEVFEHIKGMEEVLEQQKKKELDEEISLASRTVHSPDLMNIANLLGKLPNIVNNKGFSNNATELKNASNIKFQTEILAGKESSSDGSYKLLGKKINDCLSKSHSPDESEDLNENVIPNFDSSLEDAIFELRRTFEKSEIVPVASKKMNSNHASKLNEKLDTPNHEVLIEVPIPTIDAVRTDLLKEKKVIKNSNDNFVTEEKDAYNCHDKNSELKSKVFEIINTVPNSPCRKWFDENRSKPETPKNCSQMPVESLSSKSDDSIPFLEALDSQSVSSPPKLSLNAADDPIPVKSAVTSETNQDCSGEDCVNGSVLEHAITSLEIYSPVVGLCEMNQSFLKKEKYKSHTRAERLDFIVEDKRNLLVEGSFPFRCKLCNSSIARTLILDHILGSKHRLRYMKIKDEATYDLIMHLTDQEEKNKKILEATAKLEMEFGRGKVVVSSSKGTKDMPTTNFDKIDHIDKNMGFECNAKSDLESHETISSKQSKNENQILTSFTKSLEDKLESLNSFISSYSNELTPDKKNKVLANDEKSIQGYLNEQSSTKCEISSDIKEEISESMYSLSNIHEHYKFFNENSSMKRTFSSFEEIPKKLKQEHIRYESMDMNANAFKDSNAQTTIDPEFHSTAIPEQKSQSEFFISSLLEHLSKCDISSDDEANIVLLAVNVLMKLLLRYKLKDCVNVDVENLMSTLHCRSSQELIKILDLIKEKNLSDDKNICSPLKMDVRIANTYPLKDETKLQMSNTACNLNFSAKKGMTFQSSDYMQLSNTEIENADSYQGMSTIAQNLESYVQSMGSSSSGCIPSTMNVSQSSKSSLLQQPSFLGWPNSSNVISSTKQSLANVTQPGQNHYV